MKNVPDSIRTKNEIRIYRMISNFPPEQEAIREKCFHPSGAFDESREKLDKQLPLRSKKPPLNILGKSP